MSKSLAPSVGRTVFPPNVNSWHELAALGCFVYCYLRADGSPYYVGIAKLAHRPIKRLKSDTKPPRDHSRICVLRSGLTWDTAQDWERFYVARYGRKDLGTGILRNRTAGGDGVANPSEEVKRRMKPPCWSGKVSAAIFAFHGDTVAKRHGYTFEEWSQMPELERRRARGRRYTRLHHEVGLVTPKAVLTANAGKQIDLKYGLKPGTWISLDKAQKDRAHARFKLGHTGNVLLAKKLPQPSKPSATIRHAARYGICPVIWLMTTSSQKDTICKRWKNGERNPQDLLEGDSTGKSIATAAHNDRQRSTAAAKLGIDLVEYKALTKNQKAIAAQFVKRNPGVTVAAYIARRGWSKPA
jgi:hypothetical protein